MSTPKVISVLKKPAALILTLALLLSVIASAAAQTGEVAAGGRMPVSLNQAQGPTDAAEMEAFLDDLFTRQMEEYHIAGAAVAVVKDGQLFFAKGYGYADVENNIPVDAYQTVFATGSIGKVLTWTAVMQLAEQGKLDLDADVNTYLDFRVPDTYPQPITLKHLMTHTSGFENRLLDSAVTDIKDIVPAREWLVAHMHAQVRPPGTAAGYSNFNAMLAGYIVARVSGQPYDQYIQEHIFDPLGMAHSTARSQIPSPLSAQATLGYTFDDGVFRPFPAYTPQPALEPSGAHRVTVTDMARFMIAHLQHGFYGDAATEIRILEESTAQQMHSTLYTPHPRLTGTAYGLFDFTDNGQRTLGHSGELPPMHSLLLLLPDQNLGVFVAYNSAGGSELTNQHLGFQRAFFDHYYPAAAVEPIQPPADFAGRAERFVGAYSWTMGAKTTLIKIMGLFGTAQISDAGDGTLLFTMDTLEWRFVEVEPRYFRQVDGPYGLAFREDDQGRITYMYTDLMPQFAFERLDWYETPGFHMSLALGCILVFLSMILVGLIRAILDRRLSGDRKPAPRGAHVANRIILGICILNLLFLVGAALWIMPISIVHPLRLIFKIVLGLGVLSALLTVAALVYTVLAWKDRYWGVAFRTYYTLVTVAAVAFVWFLNYWNLLGWRY
jgi:CubicO group peptidase (beta-lactamase class C family)